MNFQSGMGWAISQLGKRGVHINIMMNRSQVRDAQRSSGLLRWLGMACMRPKFAVLCRIAVCLIQTNISPFFASVKRLTPCREDKTEYRSTQNQRRSSSSGAITNQLGAPSPQASVTPTARPLRLAKTLTLWYVNGQLTRS